jgi:hypothetical protein
MLVLLLRFYGFFIIIFFLRENWIHQKNIYLGEGRQES